MKKKFVLSLLCVALLVLCLGGTVFARPMTEKLADNPESVLRATVEKMENERATGLVGTELFDVLLNRCGLLYRFKLGSESGWAVALEKSGAWTVEEYGIGGNPYAIAETPVYGGFGKYLEYASGALFDCITGKYVADVVFNGLNGFYACDEARVSFDRRSMTEQEIPFGLPPYFSGSFQNNCGSIAGGIVVGYFDRLYGELIPAFNAYSGGKYVAQSGAVTDVIDDLYQRMDIEANQGTTIDGFKSGLSSYVSSRGRNLSYNSLISRGQPNFSALSQAISSKLPTVVFVQKYNVIEVFSEGSSMDYIVTDYYSANHVMVAYGIKSVAYYRNVSKSVWSPVWYNPFRTVTVIEEEQFRTDSYLKVNPVMAGCTRAFYRLGDSSTIAEMLSCNIY